MRGVAEENSPADAGIAHHIDERETYEPQVVSAIVWFGLTIAAGLILIGLGGFPDSP